MAKKTISLIVEGGNASPGPPLGPALGPLGVNVGAVVAKINEATKDFKGMKVPVDVEVDTETKQFTVILKTPTTSALIAKEAGVDKGSGAPGREAKGNISFQTVVKIAKMKINDTYAKSLKGVVKEVLGTCQSMGVTVDSKSPKEVIKEVEKGLYDSILSKEAA
ncbi:MAG: 50S ribosomal protein L11 [Candidatus Brockarchaeota archaeon]|nr:50S ribosomal protein L11 [Candidatus Brockarchaeota archaeon]